MGTSAFNYIFSFFASYIVAWALVAELDDIAQMPTWYWIIFAGVVMAIVWTPIYAFLEFCRLRRER